MRREKEPRTQTQEPSWTVADYLVFPNLTADTVYSLLRQVDIDFLALY